MRYWSSTSGPEHGTKVLKLLKEVCQDAWTGITEAGQGCTAGAGKGRADVGGFRANAPTSVHNIMKSLGFRCPQRPPCAQERSKSGQRRAATTPIVIVGEDQRVRGGDAEVSGDRTHERGQVKLPVGPDYKAPRIAVAKHAAARPFLAFGPGGCGREAGLAQSLDTTARQCRPEFVVSDLGCQHVAIGLRPIERNSMGQEDGAATILDHPEQFDYPLVDVLVSRLDSPPAATGRDACGPSREHRSGNQFAAPRVAQ